MSTSQRGINLDTVKERLKRLQQTNKNSNLTWKPTDKEQTIRIVPYKYKPDNPFIELYFHYGMNGKTYLSPISFGEPDPIYEVAQKLKNSGDKESWKQGKSLEPKLRTFAPIIVRGHEADGVKFWGFGKTVYEELLSNIADNECGDITDPATGRDIVVSTIKEEGKSYPTPKVRIKMTTSQITTDREILQKIVKEQPDIRELFELKSYEELQQVLEKYLNPEEPAAESSTQPDEKKTENKPSVDQPATVAENSAGVDDIQSAFSELFEGESK